MPPILAHLQDRLHAGPTAESPQTWSALGLLTLYRLLLASTLVMLALSKTSPSPLGESDVPLFSALSVGYIVFAVICAIGLLWRWPAFRAQVYVQILFDIGFITLMMHTSNGISGGLSILLVVDIAASGVLASGRAVILIASIATLSTLAEQIYSHTSNATDASGYTQAVMLGATFFATAILAHLLAKRTFTSEKLAAQRAVDLAQMAQLTEYIIQRMQTGIIVVDAADETRLMNESAWHLLGNEFSDNQQTLEAISPDLAKQIEVWRTNPVYVPTIFRPSNTAADILPRFATLGSGAASGTLIFLEDTSGIAQQAQQLKLASLVRLTGSIAHEIRNPLAAISHAGQLLAESTTLDSGEERLTQIICTQSQRMNRIIENMLQISRRERSRLEDFELKPWLEEFIDEFARSQQIDPALIVVEHGMQNIVLRMDPSQLHQILWNLCENGLRYVDRNANPKLKLRAGLLKEVHAPFLDVIDFGCGIDPEVIPRIFDPFFTTEEAGTGLGLYIARELCECNQARLSYITMSTGGTCFRITFADPRRRQVA
ncbi:MAG: HAMP domain-containing sensor histidine kinase [Gammaproteobacteria bacterium]